MTITYHDPRARSRRPHEPYTERLDLRQARVVGLLENGFPDAGAFLDAIEQALAPVRPLTRFVRYRKPSASVPASSELVQRIVDECDALVTAYGH